MKLTQATVAALKLPKGKSETITFDDDLPGFGLRMRAGGSCTWIYQYKLGSQHRRVTLGNAAALTVTQARKTATELHAHVRLGKDPAGEKSEGRVRATETMGAIVQTYLAHQRQRVRPRSYAGTERHLLTYSKPLLILPLVGINRRTIAARLALIAAKSGAPSANRMRSSLSAFFAWCMREGLLESNPASGTNVQPEKSRERVLSGDELKLIWNATAGDDDYSTIMRLLMLSGQRREEIGGLRWSEVLEDRILLPGMRTKNGHAHSVPLTATMRSILAARVRDGEFVFGARNGKSFRGWGSSKAALDRRISATGVELAHWTQHDLRRTMATWLAESGTAPHIIEAILNHVNGHKSGVAGIYNRANYEPQKRAALEKWGNHIEQLIGGKPTATIIRLGA